MARAKDKPTKRKRTPTAKAAAAASTVAPAKAGKKPKKKSAKPPGAAQCKEEFPFKDHRSKRRTNCQ